MLSKKLPPANVVAVTCGAAGFALLLVKLPNGDAVDVLAGGAGADEGAEEKLSPPNASESPPKACEADDELPVA